MLPVGREITLTSPVPGGVGLRVPVATSRLELPPDLLKWEKKDELCGEAKSIW